MRVWLRRDVQLLHCLSLLISETPVYAQSLPGSIQHLAGSELGLVYIFIYLASLFQLPIFFAWLLGVGKMAHPHQALSVSLSAPASAQYIWSNVTFPAA